MKYTPLFLLLFSLATSCKKEGLTKETQNGANTFSFLIDGELFKPAKSDDLLFNSDPVLFGGLSVFDDYTIARVSAANRANYPSKYITIQIENLTGLGEYLLSDGSNSITYTIYGATADEYSSYNTKKGKIVITKDDRANFILSGTFEFEGEDSDNPGKIVKVTSGRFDVNYKR